MVKTLDLLHCQIFKYLLPTLTFGCWVNRHRSTKEVRYRHRSTKEVRHSSTILVIHYVNLADVCILLLWGILKGISSSQRRPSPIISVKEFLWRRAQRPMVNISGLPLSLFTIFFETGSPPEAGAHQLANWSSSCHWDHSHAPLCPVRLHGGWFKQFSKLIQEVLYTLNHLPSPF